jgi:ribonuclease HI
MNMKTQLKDITLLIDMYDASPNKKDVLEHLKKRVRLLYKTVKEEIQKTDNLEENDEGGYEVKNETKNETKAVHKPLHSLPKGSSSAPKSPPSPLPKGSASPPSEVITLYTDGSCSPNPGKGGWGFIALINGVEVKKSFGGDISTTNNIMELTAVIKAIEFSSNFKNLKIFSDSQYVINCAKGVWKRTKNVDIWKVYDKVSKGKNIEFVWVRGHNGDKYNEMVDVLANEGRCSVRQ